MIIICFLYHFDQMLYVRATFIECLNVKGLKGWPIGCQDP